MPVVLRVCSADGPWSPCADFHHSNDYWTFRDGASCKPDEGVALGMGGTIDLWNDPPYSVPAHMPPIGRPAKEYVNSPGCTDSSQNVSGTCVYEDQLFEDRIHRVIRRRPKDQPLFMFWATHIVHGPLQVPDAYFDRFETFVDNPQRAKYHSMVSWIDGAVGRVVQSLRDEGLYNDTLICMNSDNGGPLPSGNNFPLKGGKFVRHNLLSWLAPDSFVRLLTLTLHSDWLPTEQLGGRHSCKCIRELHQPCAGGVAVRLALRAAHALTFSVLATAITRCRWVAAFCPRLSAALSFQA